jgi:hypothetical protein
MTDYKCKSPILFITFIKENETKRVFETIRQVKPDKLYIASDGARTEKQGEKEKVENIRSWLVSNVDWNCEIKTKFNEKNLGCGHGPADAISWFFENEEMGIIIEDDILADLNFFRFCDEMLEKYKDDDRIGLVGGFNRIDKELHSNEYYFSKYAQTWGWATWRRAWSDYDFTVSSWENLKNTDFIYKVFPKRYISKSFFDIFDKTCTSYDEAIITWWDYQWIFCNLLKNRLTIMPYCNLITNIGFTEDATHTFDKNNPVSNVSYGSLYFPLKHPISYNIDMRRDKVFLDSLASKPKPLIYRAIRKCYRILKKVVKKSNPQ